MAEGLEALLRSAQAALSAASATLPSAEERRAEAAAAESLAVSGAGAVAKTAVGVAGRLRRQWLRWLLRSTAMRTIRGSSNVKAVKTKVRYLLKVTVYY